MNTKEKRPLKRSLSMHQCAAGYTSELSKLLFELAVQICRGTTNCDFMVIHERGIVKWEMRRKFIWVWILERTL